MDTRISVASDSLETKRERNNSKNAEKMAIRVEGSSSGECDGSWNRIAVSSAKCKGNKARWNFYQGQQGTVLRVETNRPEQPMIFYGHELKIQAFTARRGKCWHRQSVPV